jgi:hypothetical protein
MANEITRRNFIKGAAAAAIAVSLSGVLTGCGGQAVNEVKLGAYVVKLYNANTRATSQGTGENTYSVTAKAKISHLTRMPEIFCRNCPARECLREKSMQLL